ncbi:MAG TPA: Hsp20/alpha crystallin family protein [Candidatus Limnocylindrales bacterium]|nr:Hsp20/alpha crystallin family protein [Candidatus Limnocylindrales bacterium]
MPRYYFLDPSALTLERARIRPGPAEADQDQMIPVDVYRDGDLIVIEAAVPGARLEDLEISCEEGLLTIRAGVSEPDRDYAIREIPRGVLSRTLALPADCSVETSSAAFQDGILRITIPRAHVRTPHTIKVESAGASDASRIVMDRREVAPNEIVDAVKGQDYREVEAHKKRRSPPGR